MTGPRLVMMEGVAELFTRPVFAEVAQGFRDRNLPTPEQFLPAYAATFEAQRARNAWGIFDWSCAGMASDLPWAASEPARLRDLMRDVRLLAEDMMPVVLFDCSLPGGCAGDEASRP